MKVNDRQRYLMIAEAAYFRAQQRNFAPGHEQEDWLAAERHVDEMLKNMEAVPMQAELQSSAETQPASQSRRTKTAAATSGSTGAGTGEGEIKQARSRRSKTAATAETAPAKPRGRQSVAAKANLENPDFMADMVTGPGTGEASLQTGMGDAGIGLGADQSFTNQTGAGAAGMPGATGTGTETEAKPKRGRRTKAATPESAVAQTTRRPGRPKKTLH